MRDLIYQDTHAVTEQEILDWLQEDYGDENAILDEYEDETPKRQSYNYLYIYA